MKKSCIVIFLCVLTACSSKSTSFATEIQTLYPAKTLKTSATDVPAQTQTSTSSPSPTVTLTPTLSPTPIGGGSGRFVYSKYDGFFWNSGEALFSVEDIEDTTGNDYDFMNALLSDKSDNAFIYACNYAQSPNPFPACDAYLLKDGFREITHIAGISIPMYRLFSWSPDGKNMLFISTSGGGKQITFSLLDLNGNMRTFLRQSGYDSNPFWTSDSSGVYWTKNDVPRFEGLDGSSSRLDDLSFVEGRFFLGALEYSSNDNDIAFIVQDRLYLVNSDFSDPVYIDLGVTYGRASYIHWSYDSSRLAIGQLGGDAYLHDMRVYDVETLEMITEFEGPITNLCGFSPDGKNLVVMLDENIRDDDPSSDLYFLNILDDEKQTRISNSGIVNMIWGCPIWLEEEEYAAFLDSSKQKLPSGSLFHLLKGDRSTFLNEHILVDNRDSQEWYGFDSGPIWIETPFRMELQIIGEGEHASLSISGRTNQPGRDWWEGIHRLFIHAELDKVIFEFCDGTRETCAWFPVPIFDDEEASPFTVKFLDRFGKVIEVYNSLGESVGYFNLQKGDGGKGLENGLLPDGKLFVGVLLSPGASIEISKLEVQIAE